MGIETLGGHDRADVVRKGMEARMMYDESHGDFEEIRKTLMTKPFLGTLFNSSFMTELRSDPLYQRLKTEGNFTENEEEFSNLASRFTDVWDEYDMGDVRQQAAHLSVLAQMDSIQDADLKKKSALDAAAE